MIVWKSGTIFWGIYDVHLVLTTISRQSRPWRQLTSHF